MVLSSNTNRKVHRIAGWIVAFPVILIFITGIGLQIKSWIPWIQPAAIQTNAREPFISLEQILKASISDASAHVNGWNEIRAIDIRPASGVARVRTRSDYEITIDLGTGVVLQSAPRRVQLFIQLHEGSFFGTLGKYGVFLPTGILLTIIWITGVFLLINPIFQRMKRQVRTGG